MEIETLRTNVEAAFANLPSFSEMKIGLAIAAMEATTGHTVPDPRDQRIAELEAEVARLQRPASAVAGAYWNQFEGNPMARQQPAAGSFVAPDVQRD